MSGGPVGYAFVLGMIALLNPCGFPLLPIYLAAFVDGGGRGYLPRTLSALRAGVAITGGFLAVFAVAGLLAGSAHAMILAVAPWMMIGVGAAIAVLGAVSVSGRTISMHRVPRFRSSRGLLAIAGFGAAYAVGSLSCSLPVFVAAVGGALASGSAVVLFAVVLAYALGMGLFATVLSIVVAAADGMVFRSLRPLAAALPRVAGALCILIGLYLVGYWVAEVGGPDFVGPVTSALDATQSFLASMVESAWLPLGGALVATVLTVLLTAALRRGANDGAFTEPNQGEDSR